MSSAEKSSPRCSQIKPPPITPTPYPRHRRPKAEDCERITAAEIRRCVGPEATNWKMADGTLLELRWAVVRGCGNHNCGTGTELTLACPQCSATVRVLRQPPGEGWSCWRCRPVSHPSHRRPGSRGGRQKPPSWRLAQVVSEQRRVVELLGLEQWPPRKILWKLSDLEAAPLHPGAPRLSRKRRNALLLCLDALETLRYGAIFLALKEDLKASEIEPSKTTTWEQLTHQANQTLIYTSWARRRRNRYPGNRQPNRKTKKQAAQAAT